MLNFLQNEFMVTLTILGILIPASLSIFSVFNYDSFDRKLMPRNKSNIAFIKQIFGLFMVIIPTLIIGAYLIAFFITKLFYISIILIFLLYIIIFIYFLSLTFFFLEWVSNKFHHPTIQLLLNWQLLYQLNKKYKVNILFGFLFTVLIYIAVIHLQIKTVAILTQDFLYQFIIFSIFMGTLIIGLLLPLYEENNKKEYKLLINIKTEAELLVLLQNEPLILEYFSNESVIIYSAKNYKYRILRKQTSDTDVSYEVYELIS